MTPKRAVAYVPEKRSAALVEVADPGEPGPGQVLIRPSLVGFCGTDREIVQGGIAVPPSYDNYLILGHEMAGFIEQTGEGVKQLVPGDFVVPMVRLPCSSCIPCSLGRSDFCLSGEYLEFGITRLHGFAQPSVIVPAQWVVPVEATLGDLAVLTEPLSIIEKTLEQARTVIGRIPGLESEADSWGSGKHAIVTGAGSIGLLSVYLLTQLGFTVEVVDLKPENSSSAQLAIAAGASYIPNDAKIGHDLLQERLGQADLVIEATGNPELAFSMLELLSPGGVLMWVGVAAEDQMVKIEATQTILRAVIGHNAVLGTVNSSKAHYVQAAADLKELSRRTRFTEILSSVVPIESFEEAIWPSDDSIKRAVRITGEA